MTVATIETIASIRPHSNADVLELATIKGWQVCVKKNEFAVGDKCIFVTVDSIFDPHASVEFLRNKSFRIKTCRLRGELSQGIAFKLSMLAEFNYSGPIDVGMDVSGIIGCKHYEKPIAACLSGIARGSFPSSIRRTDEDNIKNFPQLLEEFRELPFYISMKMDGSSGTFYVNQNQFGVCSRNLELIESEGNSFWQMARKYALDECIKSFYGDTANIAIQGEVYGPGIQDNIMGETNVQLGIFNIWNIDTQRYLGYSDIQMFCETTSVPMVPVIDIGTNFRYTLAELQAMANNLKYPNGNLAEGLVIRPMIERYSEVLRGRLSGKIISEPFELKYG
jgi:RNA ligase (TIGR02306 family)